MGLRSICRDVQSTHYLPTGGEVLLGPIPRIPPILTSKGTKIERQKPKIGPNTLAIGLEPPTPTPYQAGVCVC